MSEPQVTAFKTTLVVVDRLQGLSVPSQPPLHHRCFSLGDGLPTKKRGEKRKREGRWGGKGKEIEEKRNRKEQNKGKKGKERERKGKKGKERERKGKKKKKERGEKEGKEKRKEKRKEKKERERERERERKGKDRER